MVVPLSCLSRCWFTWVPLHRVQDTLQHPDSQVQVRGQCPGASLWGSLGRSLTLGFGKRSEAGVGEGQGWVRGRGGAPGESAAPGT